MKLPLQGRALSLSADLDEAFRGGVGKPSVWASWRLWCCWDVRAPRLAAFLGPDAAEEIRRW